MQTVSSVGTLVIGASQAGLQLATSLRDLGATGPVTLVGGEPRAPYQRPPLSKAYLQGKLPEDGLILRGPDFYRDRDIDLICGEWIDAVRLTDPEKGAGEATTRSGRTLAFDRLALSVGGAPRRLRAPGSELAGIHYLRDVEDAAALRADLERARRVVVVGGGFVGLEAAAAAALGSGKQVTVVEAASHLLARAVAPAVSDFYAAAHRRRGTTVLLGRAVAGFHGVRGRVSGVELADGHVEAADVVVVGIGLAPQTELAESMGLECIGGVVVDDLARTSIPSVVAAGDCTTLAHPEHGSLRLESVQNAITQAKVAAATLLGVEPPSAGVPWFWSDQADLKLQMAGLNIGYDRVILRGDPSREQFSALYYRGDRLLSIDAVNAPRDYMAVRRLLEMGRNVPAEAASDPDVALKDFLRAS